MNTSNENHTPTDSDDLHDRLVDLGLIELLSGVAPPDLSSQIAAATLRQSAPVVSGPRTRQDRAFWVQLAIAVMLLIGTTTVLLTQWNLSSRQSRLAMKESARQDRLGSTVVSSPATSSTRQLAQELHNHTDATKPFPTTTASQLDKVKKALEVAKADRLSKVGVDPSVIASDGSAATTPAASSTNLNWAGKLVVPKLESQAPRQEWTKQLNENIADLTPAAPGLKAASTSSSNSTGLRGLINDSSAQTIPQPAGSPSDTFHFYNEHDARLFQQGDPVTMLVTPRIIVQAESEVQLGVEVDAYNKTVVGRGPGSSGDKYTQIVENPFIKAEGGAAVSTFSIDVDTASYANVRQFLLQMNQLPPPDAVRIEELVNYFQHDYEAPKQSDEAPFAAHVEVASCPWAPDHRLARIGIKGREMDRTKRPQSNLVFLVDVSGSMNEPAKLPLVVYGLEQLTRELGENDHIAIVVYAGTEGVVLPSTSGSKQDTILAALGKLQAGGSTAGGAGIQLAYQIAEDNFIKGGTNRVILCTDGDFNVGVTNTAELQRMVEKKAKDTGVFLSTLGFGRGNLNDAMMVAISDHGNGNYHYIDNRTEARRVLVQEMTGTLVTIAKDVKIQVEFNPAKVAGYRLIGYEKRMLRTEDFNNDKKDAGEIGAGHTVTALYEIVPTGKEVGIPTVDPLKYQQPVGRTILSVDGKAKEDGKNRTDKIVHPTAESSNELLTLKMRYKAPDGDTSKKLEWPITDDGKSFSAASGDLKFAASVAGFGLLLRNSEYKGNLTFAADIELAQGGIGEDPHGYRKEFIELIRKAKELRHE